MVIYHGTIRTKSNKKQIQGQLLEESANTSSNDEILWGLNPGFLSTNLITMSGGLHAPFLTEPAVSSWGM